jgi:hypothetical protein
LWLDNIWPNYGPLFFFLIQNYQYIVNKFFCAELVLHFSTNFVQTFTEALSSSALAHIVGVLWLDNFWPNYGPSFFPYTEYIVNTSSVAIPPTLFMFYIAHSYIVCCLYLYFKYNIFIYNGDNWKPGFMALPCFLFLNYIL